MGVGNWFFIKARRCEGRGEAIARALKSIINVVLVVKPIDVATVAIASPLQINKLQGLFA